MFVRDPGARLTFEEVIDVFLNVAAALGLVALGVLAVVTGERPFLRAIELRGAEPLLEDPLRLDGKRGKAGFDLAVLHTGAE